MDLIKKHDISYDLVGFVNYSRKELVKKNNDLKEAMRQFKMFAHNVKVQVSSIKSKLIKEEKNSRFRIKEGLMADVK